MRAGMLYAMTSVIGSGTAGFIVAAAWMTAIPEPADLDLTSVSIPLLPAPDAAAQGIGLASAPVQNPQPAMGGPLVAATAILALTPAAEESAPAVSGEERQAALPGAEDPQVPPREPLRRLALIERADNATARALPPNTASAEPVMTAKPRPSDGKHRRRVTSDRSAKRVRIWYGRPPNIYPAPYRSRPVIIMVEPRWR